jgi:hypothetical protein
MVSAPRDMVQRLAMKQMGTRNVVRTISLQPIKVAIESIGLVTVDETEMEILGKKLVGHKMEVI